MTPQHITLELVDVDGAVRETAEAAGMGRGDFLRRGALVGAGALTSGLFIGGLGTAEARISSRRKSKANDVKILQYALTLEYLEAEFYFQASRSGALTDPVVKRFADVVTEHESEHVTFLKRALGRRAISKPTFDFGDTVTNQDKFKATAQVLEDTGVSAYLGQAANVFQKAVLIAAGRIVTVEARHAAWIRYINHGGTPTQTALLPAPRTFDDPKTEGQILAAVKRTGFIRS